MSKKFIIVISASLLLLICAFLFLKKEDITAQAYILDERLSDVLEKVGTQPARLIKKESAVEKGWRKKYAHIKAEYEISQFPPIDVFAEIISNEIELSGFDLLKFKYLRKERTSELIFDFGYKRTNVCTLVLTQALKESYNAKAKIAVVIDDWGYDLDNMPLLYEIDSPLTLAILPSLKNSTGIARAARMKGYEIILHLPLEPHDEGLRKEEMTIYTDMSKKRAIDIFDKNLASVPFAKGISNHMGSKATEDKKLMGIIFDRLKSKDLFFLDSLVTEHSACERLAQEKKVRFAERSVFLDNELNPEYIEKQFSQLVKIALIRGSAIGICHEKEATLKTLKTDIDKFKNQGIEFVYLSELVR